ncbi:MAG: lipoate--protein ligase [Mesotoga sp.]|uniref:lipoate--protein ligase n=2 Tax=Mesotoga TaxID=1184396 RepID=UPI000EF16AEA|nr:lipoate--protein ligase [Mesotoga sp. H07pep.5.4]RLL84646.1 lipoate--protein ligase [Mesotoga sp. H07pep.5.4]
MALGVDRITNTVYVESNSFDPWLNLAIEEYLLNSYARDSSVLYLWQNEKTVVIGRNQNAWQECRLGNLERDGGRLARRLSGGGAVYHDLGNLNFTFLMPRKEYNLHRQLSVIVDAVKELGIEAHFSGRNDILAGGKKFSGNAFYHGQFASYHHGTILIDVDTGKLSEYLNVSKEKIESKGVKSVVSRVVNLKEMKPDLTIDTMKKAMYRGFIEEYGQIDNVLDFERVIESEDIGGLYEKYSSKEWLLGRNPEFNFRASKRFQWGGIELLFTSRKGKIVDVTVYSDSMDVDFIEELRRGLKNIEFSRSSILKALNNLPRYIERDDIINWLGITDFI